MTLCRKYAPYRPETNYKVNHYTLGVRDPLLDAEIVKHKIGLISKILRPIQFFSVLIFVLTYFNFFVTGVGHPVMLVTSVGNLSVTAGITFFMARGSRKATYVAFAFYFNHVLGAILVYSDRLPESWLNYQKDDFQWQVFVPFCMVMMLPTAPYGLATLVMTPMLMAGTYFQTVGQSRTLESYRQYLPEELQAEIRPLRSMLTINVMKMSILSCAFLAVHYLNQFLNTKLTLDKQNARKGQKMLYDFLNNQRNAIIIYKLNKNANWGETEWSSSDLTIEVPFKNAAVAKIFGFEVCSMIDTD